MLATLIADQKAQRAEIARMRDEIAASHAQARPQLTVDVPTAEERHAARMAEVAKFSHYCPGCGKLYNYPRECEGSPVAPHQPIEVVSTDELSGDPANHTAAPDSP